LRTIKEYLKEHLKLDLSEEKTLVTRPQQDKALFLGTHISISNHVYFNKGTHGQRKKSISQLVMTAPLDRIYKKLESAGF
jgi:hypothetical protein